MATGKLAFGKDTIKQGLRGEQDQRRSKALKAAPSEEDKWMRKADNTWLCNLISDSEDESENDANYKSTHTISRIGLDDKSEPSVARLVVFDKAKSEVVKEDEDAAQHAFREFTAGLKLGNKQAQRLNAKWERLRNVTDDSVKRNMNRLRETLDDEGMHECADKMHGQRLRISLLKVTTITLAHLPRLICYVFIVRHVCRKS